MIKCEFTKDEFNLLKASVGSLHQLIKSGLKAPLKKRNKLEAEKLNCDIHKLLLKLEDFEPIGGENNGY